MVEGEKKLDDYKINVSVRRPANFYVFRAKYYLENDGKVEFHSLGEAQTISVEASQTLIVNGYATIQKIETCEVEVTARNFDKIKKAKLIISMVKTEDFEEKLKNFNQIKKENEEAMKQSADF